MKKYQFKFEIGGVIVPIQARGFSYAGAYRKALRKALQFLG